MGKGRNEDLTVTRRKGLSRVWKNREGYLYWGGGVVQREEKVEGIIGRKGIGIGLIFFANEECKFLGRGGLREVLIAMKGEKTKTIEMFFTDFAFSLLVIFLFLFVFFIGNFLIRKCVK